MAATPPPSHNRGLYLLQVHVPNRSITLSGLSQTPNKRTALKRREKTLVGLSSSRIEVHPLAREMTVLQRYRCTCIGGLLFKSIFVWAWRPATPKHSPQNHWEQCISTGIDGLSVIFHGGLKQVGEGSTTGEARISH